MGIEEAEIPLLSHPRASLVRSASIALNMTSDCTVQTVGASISSSRRSFDLVAKKSGRFSGRSRICLEVNVAPIEHLCSTKLEDGQVTNGWVKHVMGPGDLHGVCQNFRVHGTDRIGGFAIPPFAPENIFIDDVDTRVLPAEIKLQEVVFKFFADKMANSSTL